MTATFSMTGPNGTFGGNLVETGFDDSPESDTSPGGGKARTLVLNTGGVPANAVRLDFLTDAEWLMLSEVTIQGRAATNVIVKATAILDTPPNFNAGAGAGLLTDGIIGPDNWLNGLAIPGLAGCGLCPLGRRERFRCTATATDIRPGRYLLYRFRHGRLQRRLSSRLSTRQPSRSGFDDRDVQRHWSGRPLRREPRRDRL